MASGNVELVLRAVDAFNQHDLDALTGIGTDDFEFVPYLPATVVTKTYCGPKALRRYFEDADEVWETIRVRVDEVRAVGDRVLVLGELGGRGRASALAVQVPLAWVVDFRDGRFKRVYSYANAGEALQAVGLQA
jgi:ketosteroid isomerase-like protein